MRAGHSTKGKVEEQEDADAEDAAHDDRVAAPSRVDHADHRIEARNLGCGRRGSGHGEGQASGEVHAPATPFMRDWMPERLDRCAANSARVAYAWLRGQGSVQAQRGPDARARGNALEGIVCHAVAVVDPSPLGQQRVGHGRPGRRLEGAVH